MVESPQSSFIPKKAVDARPSTSKRTGSIGFLRAGAVIVFIIVILAAVGVFLYTELLERNITRKEAALAQAREAFEPQLIEELARLDARVDSAEALLSGHIAPTQLFGLIESITLQTVRFNTLSFAEEVDGYVLGLSGEAQSFASVALQSDVLGESRLIQEPVVSGLSLGSSGRVNFTVSAKVDPSLFVYTPRTSQTTEDLFEDDGEDLEGLDDFSDLEDELSDIEESLEE